MKRAENQQQFEARACHGIEQKKSQPSAALVDEEDLSVCDNFFRCRNEKFLASSFDPLLCVPRFNSLNHWNAERSEHSAPEKALSSTKSSKLFTEKLTQTEPATFFDRNVEAK